MTGPLSGVRVVDLTHVLNGPFCTLLLAQLGAEVIKIEHGAGDRYRHSWLPPDVKRDGYEFIAVNSNKKGILLDLKAEKGRELFRQLVLKSDVVVENFTTGTMERLGLGYEDLRRIKPDIVYACSRGYGESGPYKHMRANAGTIQAITGYTDAQARQAEKPGILGPGNGDEVAGMSMALGIVSALFHRNLTGQGQKIDVSMQEAQLGFMVAIMHTHFEGVQVSVPPKQCADGHFFFHVPDMTDALWGQLATSLGRPELVSDQRFATVTDRRINHAAVQDVIGEMVRGKTRQELWEILVECGISCAPVLSVGEALEDPHLKARDAVVELDHPEAGPVKVMAPWIRMSETPGGITSPAPLRGQHNREVFGGILGLSDAEIDALKAEGVIGDPEKARAAKPSQYR